MINNIQINILQAKKEELHEDTRKILEEARDYSHALNLRLLDMVEDLKKEIKALKAENQAIKKAVIKEKLQRLKTIENADLRTSA